MAKTKVVICPYCGETQAAGERCRACGGLFDALSRQASHNAMGPWWIRDTTRTNMPGCSYETILRLIERGQITKVSVVRGPTTRQFWTIAKHVPGIAHLLGYCHNCDASVDPGDHGCHACGVPFGAYLDRNFLGLPDVKPMPWDADMEEPAAHRIETAAWAAPTSRAISSFASDEELLGRSRAAPVSGGPADETQTDPAPAPATATLTAAPAPIDETQTDFLASAATRAMRRTITQQSRMIRMLAVLVVAIGLLLVAAVWMSRSGGATKQPAVTEPTTEQPTAAVTEHSTPDLELETPPAEVLDVHTSDPDPVAQTPPPGWEADYERAVELLATAGDESLELDVRKSACEEALTILRGIRDAYGDSGHFPAQLDAHIAAGENELERLELKEFFP